MMVVSSRPLRRSGTNASVVETPSRRGGACVARARAAAADVGRHAMPIEQRLGGDRHPRSSRSTSDEVRVGAEARAGPSPARRKRRAGRGGTRARASPIGRRAGIEEQRQQMLHAGDAAPHAEEIVVGLHRPGRRRMIAADRVDACRRDTRRHRAARSSSLANRRRAFGRGAEPHPCRRP